MAPAAIDALARLHALQRDAFARERHEWNRRFTASLLDRRIMLLGYSIGGTLTAIFSALVPESSSITEGSMMSLTLSPA